MKLRYAVLGFIVGLALTVGAQLAPPARATVQNQTAINNTVCIDLVNNVAYLDVLFTDSDDGLMIASNRYTMMATGPVKDLKGRTIAASTPANIITDITALKGHLATATTGNANVKP